MADAITRHSDTCKVTCLSNKRTIDAVVTNVIDKKTLDVILNKSIKLNMIWNGRKYEGRSGGLDFESDGPTITTAYTGKLR